MVQTIIMPKLGQTVEESTVVKWHKQVGDKVIKGDILFEIETDKAVLEIESFFEGTLLKIIVPEGMTVPVTAPVAFIGEPGEPIPAVPAIPKTNPAEAPAPGQSVTTTHPAAQVPIQVPRSELPAVSATSPMPQNKPISPRARRLLKDHPINPDPIPGTGPGGRVTEKDVLAYLEAQGYYRIRITPAAKAFALKEKIDILRLNRLPANGDRKTDDRVTIEMIEQAVAEKPKEMSKIRQIIARRLTQSFTSVPHFYVSVSADMTDLLNFRKELKKAGKFYSVTDFIMKSAALALKKFPAVNSSTDGRTIRWHSRVQLGMAVDVKEGLVVPVIRDADIISLDELHARSASLVQKARWA